MTLFRVGIIGCGRPRHRRGATGYGMAHAHARGYEVSADARIVALADVNLDNARAFQAQHGGERLYQDYRQMLAQEQLDIVSITTWPHLHAEMVITAAEAGVRAIHCEKPMALTYGDAFRMVAACDAHGVQLTVNHQRRFGPPYRRARELLRSGAIGQLIRVEASCPDLLDWGTHWLDMMFFYNDETPAEWVLARVDGQDGQSTEGLASDYQGISSIRFRNGVEGLLVTSEQSGAQAANRLVGTEGVIEVGPTRNGALRWLYRNWERKFRGTYRSLDAGIRALQVLDRKLLSRTTSQALRIWRRGQRGWRHVAVKGRQPSDAYVNLAILDLIEALKTGREPELAGRKALQATELIFATIEASRRRSRVDLPLSVESAPKPAWGEGRSLTPRDFRAYDQAQIGPYGAEAEAAIRNDAQLTERICEVPAPVRAACDSRA